MLTRPLNRLHQSLAGLGFAALIGLASPMAFAQITAGTTGIDASGNATSEMAACRNGKSQEDRATCEKEVRNANAAKRSGKLSNDGDFQANAMMRCNVFKMPDDKKACEARVMNTAQAQGSVAGGGVLRETTTVIPAVQ